MLNSLMSVPVIVLSLPVLKSAVIVICKNYLSSPTAWLADHPFPWLVYAIGEQDFSNSLIIHKENSKEINV